MTLANQHPRVALYARVSSDQQAEAGTIASQVEALQERIRSDGFALDPELCFLDEGYSGSTLIRPALERLRDTVTTGAIDRLYVHSPDRLARKYAYQVLLVDELQRCGVSLIFLNRELGRSPEDDLLLQVQGMVAEYERAKILERSRRGKRHAAAQGSVNVLSGAPYGYRYVSKHEGGGQARYEILFEQARVVRQIFAWVGQDGCSLAEVCRRLRRQGTPSPTGKVSWERTTIWGMLKNPAYCGTAGFGKTQIGDLRKRLRSQRGKPEQPRRAYSVYDTPERSISIPVPSLISAELFAAVDEQLKENQRRQRQRARGARHLLQGLLVCQRCGYAYYGKRVSPRAAKGKKQRYAYYRCTGTDAYRFGGQRLCHNKQVRTDLLEGAVWQDVCALLKDPSRLETEFERRRDNKNGEQDRKGARQLEHLIQQVKRGIARLIDAYGEGLVDKDEFEPRIRGFRERLTRLEAEAKEQADREAEKRELRLVIGRLQEFAEKVKTGLEKADWTTQREIIRTLVRRIEIAEEEVRVVYRVSLSPFEQGPEGGRLPDCRRGVGGGFGQLGALGGGFGQVHGVSSFKHGYSPDGKALMLAAAPRALQFVHFPTGKQIGPGLGHTISLTSVAFTANGGQLLTQDAKSTRSWNAVTGKDLGTITIKLPPALPSPLFSPPIISPDGRVGGVMVQSFKIAGGQFVQKWEVILFDTASGKVLRRSVLEVGPQFLLPTMHFSPDSKMLALHSGAKKKIELYEVSSGKLRRTLDADPAAPPAQGGIFPGMMAPFQKMLYSADGKALAFQDGPGANIVVRDTTTGNEIASLTPVKDSLAMQRAFSSDGRCLAVEISDGTVTVYELASGKPRRTYGTKRPPPSAINNDPLVGFVGDPWFIDQSRVSVAIAPDGKLLALSGPGGAVHLWDVLTGKEWAALRGHTTAVTAVAFVPNGKTLASASADTTALIWDVVKIARPALPVKALKPGDLEIWWQTLADDDAAKAHAAMADFAAVPNDAVAWIKERVKPAAPLDMKRVEELMKQLDDGQYKVREKATGELLKIGELLVPVFDKALAAKPSLEMKKRLEDLRTKMTCMVLQGDRLRVFRAVEVLEIIGTLQARQVLQTLAEGAPEALVTTSAQAVLRR